MFTLFTTLATIAAAFADTLLGYAFEDTGPVGGAISLAFLIPSVSVGARRLHDIGRSGWWQLLLFAIIIGWIVLLVWFCTDGESGDNRFGPDPKGDGQSLRDVFS